MTEKRPGVLTMITDVEPEYEDDFNRWLSEEVLPQRVTIGGVLGARRWVREDIGQRLAIPMEPLPRYLLMYDFDDVTIPSQEAWQAIAGSSEWGRRITPHMHNTRHGNYREIIRF